MNDMNEKKAGASAVANVSAGGAGYPGHADKAALETQETYEYIKERVNPKIQFYSKSSSRMGAIDMIFSLANIIIASSIPVACLLGFVIEPATVLITVAVLGALTSIFTGLRLLGRFHEKATQYQQILMRLEGELAKYYSGVFYYNITDEKKKSEILISFCEATMRDEHNSWEEVMSHR